MPWALHTGDSVFELVDLMASQWLSLREGGMQEAKRVEEKLQ
jgi:hypothetical protein